MLLPGFLPAFRFKRVQAGSFLVLVLLSIWALLSYCSRYSVSSLDECVVNCMRYPKTYFSCRSLTFLLINSGKHCVSVLAYSGTV
ncbi:hypothetical protein F5B18DRAFT_114061 [Nemania serpens]|nr:hypothetical protein F5B18DRAFT_114061 [Nemania serpens]